MYNIPVFTIQSAIVRRSAVENSLGDMFASKRGSSLAKELSNLTSNRCCRARKQYRG